MTSKKLPPNVIDSKDLIIKKLSGENTQLRSKVSRILERINENEAILNHFSEIEKIVISSENILDVGQRLIMELKFRFNLEAVTLILVSDAEDTSEHPPQPIHLRSDVEHLYEVSEEALGRRLTLPYQPLLVDEWREDFKKFFYPEDEEVVRSAAILPLTLWDGLLGSLNLGSTQVERYHPGNDTSFLKLLSAKLAMGINNILSRERLHKLSVTDPLTGLYNKRYIQQRAQAEYERSIRYGTTFSFILADLDKFKSINDTHGHEMGDQVLTVFAALLKKYMRITDTCARYGGDEFTLMLPETSLQGALFSVRKLLKELNQTSIATPDGPFTLQASFGVVQFDADSHKSWEDALKEADRCMYRAKQQNGNTVFPAIPEQE